jgi:hypothetical protein
MFDIKEFNKLTPEMMGLFVELTHLEIENLALQDKKTVLDVKLSKNMQAQLEIQAQILGLQAKQKEHQEHA